MIINGVYYNGYRVSSIYISGEMVWRMPYVELSLSTELYIDITYDEDLVPTVAICQEFMSGDRIVCVNETGDSALLCAALILVSVYESQIVSTYVDESLCVAGIANGTTYDNHLVLIYQFVHGIVARAAARGRYEDIRVLIEHLSSCVAAAAQLGAKQEDLHLIVSNLVDGIAAVAKIAASQEDLHIIITHLTGCVTAMAAIGASKEDLRVIIEHLSSCVIAVAKTGGSEEGVHVVITHLSSCIAAATGIGAMQEDLHTIVSHMVSCVVAMATIAGAHNIHIDLSSQEIIQASALHGVFGRRFVAEKTAVLNEASSRMYPIVVFTCDDDWIQKMMHSAGLDILDIRSNNAFINHMFTLNRETTLTNVCLILCDSQAQYGYDISPENYGHVLYVAFGNNMCDGKVFEEIFAHEAQLINLNSNDACSCRVEEEASLCAVFILYPVQDGADLYIPQILEATQESTELKL